MRRINNTVVLLNGPFGVGKSTVARRLVERLPAARLVEPSWIAFIITRFTSAYLRGVPDLEVTRLGRRMLVSACRFQARRGDPVVVAATFRTPVGFRALLRSLEAHGFRVMAFVLMAPRDTIVERINAQRDFHGARPWRLAYLDSALSAFTQGNFGTEIPTGTSSPSEVADQILDRLAEGDTM